MEWPRRCCLNPRIWSPSTSLRGVQLNKTNPNSVDNIKVAVSHCYRHLISFTCVSQMRRWPHRLRVAKNPVLHFPSPKWRQSDRILYTNKLLAKRSKFREWTEFLQGNHGRSVLFSATQSEATSCARRIWLFQNEQRMLFPAFINLKINNSSLSTLQYIFQFEKQNILWETCWNRQSVPGLDRSKLRAKHNPWIPKKWKSFYE